MTLTPSSIRLDLKCGKGAIPRGRKCHKGPATEVAKTVALVAGAAALGLGAAALARRGSLKNPFTKAAPPKPPAGAEYLAQGNRGTVWVSKDKSTVTKIAKNPKAAKLMLGEAEIQSKAHKAGVSTPRITAVNSKTGTVSMENLQGYKNITTAAKDLDPNQKSEYAWQLVENMRLAHKANIAHGDLYSNVLVKEGKLSLIDWGESSTVERKGITDVLNVIRLTDELDPTLAKRLKTEFKPIQSKFTKRESLTTSDFNSFYDRVMRSYSKRSDAATQRLDLKCGKGSISRGEKCHKGPSTTPTVAATRRRPLAPTPPSRRSCAAAVAATPSGRAASIPPRTIHGSDPCFVTT